MDDTVKYAELPRFPGYRFGSDGTVWSKWGNGAAGMSLPDWKKINPSRNKYSGYMVVAIKDAGADSKKVWMYVHRLVLLAFVGPPPDLGCRVEACHGDGDRTNNRLDNLRWDSCTANNREKRKHGTARLGEENHLAVLNTAQVREIKGRIMAGEKKRAIARDYGVSERCIGWIGQGSTWSHV